jgi:hypothetical protein
MQLQKEFDSIMEFINVKKKCIFCNSTLRACLTNYVGRKRSNLPIIKSHIVAGKFRFNITHTTENYDIKANYIVDEWTNRVIITVAEDSETPSIDQHTAKSALDDLSPYIELYCSNKLCKHQYYLASYQLNIDFLPYDGDLWIVVNPKLYVESFKTKTLLIQNDWIREETNIYSLDNEDVKPIKFPMIDFESLGNNLIQRVQTIAVFS